MTDVLRIRTVQKEKLVRGSWVRIPLPLPLPLPLTLSEPEPSPSPSPSSLTLTEPDHWQERGLP